MGNLTNFPGITRQAFQHPLDAQAMDTLQQVPGMARLVQWLFEFGIEKVMQYENISSHLRAGERQYPSLYRKYVRMAEVLDVRKLPTLFIQTTPTVNAYAMGVENYSIVLCSGLLDILEEDEVLAILGHELGHVKCEHQLFKTIAHLLQTGGDALFSQLPIPGLDLLMAAGRISLQFAVMDWSRKAELSCDRAALLATQNPDAVARALCKLAGHTRKYPDEINLDEAEAQCELIQEASSSSLVVKMLQLQSMMSQTHPYPVVRVKEVRAWARSTQYADILAGKYRRPGPSSKGPDRWSSVVPSTARCRVCTNPACGYPCDDGFIFCPGCNVNMRSVAFACTRCRQPVEADWAACMYCASRLTQANPPS